MMKLSIAVAVYHQTLLFAQFEFALILSKTSIAGFAIVLRRYKNLLAQFVVALSQLKNLTAQIAVMLLIFLIFGCEIYDCALLL